MSTVQRLMSVVVGTNRSAEQDQYGKEILKDEDWKKARCVVKCACVRVVCVCCVRGGGVWLP